MGDDREILVMANDPQEKTMFWHSSKERLFGIGGATIDDAIRRAQASVTRSRERYGHASDEAMRDALQVTPGETERGR